MQGITKGRGLGRPIACQSNWIPWLVTDTLTTRFYVILYRINFEKRRRYRQWEIRILP